MFYHKVIHTYTQTHIYEIVLLFSLSPFPSMLLKIFAPFEGSAGDDNGVAVMDDRSRVRKPTTAAVLT